MFNAHGWICIRSSREAYSEGLDYKAMDDLDKEIERIDKQLWDELEAHLAKYGIDSDGTHKFEDGLEIRSVGLSLIKWSFYRHLNNMNGLLNLATSRNHKCKDFLDLIEWIAAKSPGSYGIIYFHDDEDDRADNEFQVMRVLKGKVEFFSDHLLSPIVPVIQNESL